MANSSYLERVPKGMQAVFDEVVSLADDFCQAHLNEEYAQIVRRTAAALCRKRPSPMARGSTAVWACGIIHAVGTINFLFDRSNPPYVSFAGLCTGFGVGQSTISNKSKQIRDTLKMRRFDPGWSLQSLTDRNPFVWTLIIDGLMVDTRDLPQEIQEALVDDGYIPYMPPPRSPKPRTP
jgi:hypothetical protein